MDLYHNENAEFTRWVIANSYLHEPFVAIDVGVQGGEHVRWRILGDCVQVYGFDALTEAIERIKAEGEKPNRLYRAMALGNEDGEREFFVPENTFSASFYEEVTLHQKQRHGDGAVGTRVVPIRQLDTLFASGELPPADYIKIDCEGYDPEVLRGAQTYLARSNILSVTVETNFNPSQRYPRTAFVEISDLLVPHGLVVYDLNCVRLVRPEYVAARKRHPLPPADPIHDVPELDVGRPLIYDFVFCRDFVAEANEPGAYRRLPGAVVEPTVDKLIKSMINFELHGLMDCAVQVAEHFRGHLASRFHVDAAIELLMRRPPYARNTADMVSALRMIAELRTLATQKDQLLASERAQMQQAALNKDAAMERERALMSAREVELHGAMIAQADEFKSKLSSLRFLAMSTGRELQARVKTRLQPPRQS